jgi:hypothetical protein
MLALLRSAELSAKERGAEADLRSLLPADQWAALDEVFEEIDAEIVRPFFSSDLVDIEENWNKWIDWSRPKFVELQKRLLPTHRDVLSKGVVDTGLRERTGKLEELSPELAQTFTRALTTAVDCDQKLLDPQRRVNALVVDADAIRRRQHASAGFALGLLLVWEILGRTPIDRERLRFAVLKVKRMTAVLWATTNTILELQCPTARGG